MKIYVDAAAVRDGSGRENAPFKHINDAAKVAQPGDEVLVAPGTYREYVNPVHGGTDTDRITYRSVQPLKAVITGAEVLKNWQPYQGQVWVSRVANSIFGDYNPYTTFVMGDWYFGPVDKHTGAVYMNDQQFYETTSLADCLEAPIYARSWERDKSIYKWYTEQDTATDETVIYANFQGQNPNQELVEINVRRNVFMPQENGIDNITVSGFNVNKAATTWAPPASYQDGMIGPHWSKGWIIEDCDISHSRCAGISLGKYRDPVNDQYFTYKHVKSPTQMERDAVCRGQYHGWLKENIGHHIIRRCNIHHCEQDGIVGRQGGVFSLIEDNHIHDINNMQELAGAEIAGIKMHAAIDVIIRRNHINDCTMGIWTDWEAQGTRITQNLLDHNYAPAGTAERIVGAMQSQDIFVEVGHGPTLIDNNLLLSKASLRLATEGVACVHNLMLGSITSIGANTDFFVDGKNQPRYTPYHIQHRTEVAGFMTILHGDDRFYNNIFVQNWPVEKVGTESVVDRAPEDTEQVGTNGFDDYPTYAEWQAQFQALDGTIAKETDMNDLMSAHFGHLPVWAAGNVYFNGAKAWKKETDNVVNTQDQVTIELVDNEGQTSLRTNLYDFLTPHDGVITTTTLGEAFEPEQRYEMPDGSDITFDEDYFGNHRDIAPLPGPFVSKTAASAMLWR
ncbi:right-handed parallel beta-helix repeat-containing protein [uncultured Levilactobacillus sp.]|uniref:right-handed parallel beta-helix repeat-containing protein n=1 Tax=uncultured Levilactobacillus sp. TaxID=2805377 RepID=UPI002597CA96|nr:right-handed parallel beta-helix repeat-containing protein [uncultured Levilactobacillus sp.]